eukprot:6172747-Pleurochrysis_carterae.AAC.6
MSCTIARSKVQGPDMLTLYSRPGRPEQRSKWPSDVLLIHSTAACASHAALYKLPLPGAQTLK